MSLNHMPHTAARAANRSATKDLTVGEPFKIIFLFTIPLLLGNLFQQFYSMADTIIVGRLVGTAALAAVGTTGPMNFLVFGFVYGLTAGFAVITAQKFGAKDEEGLRRSIATNLVLNFVSAILFTIVSVITVKPILHLINTPAEIFDDAATYITIIFCGIPATILYNAVACIVRALGDSKTPLFFLIFSSLLNIVLDIVFIYTFHMGIPGAAWATVLSQAVAGIAALVYSIIRFPQMRLKRKDFSISVSFAWKHLQIGLPMAFQFSITAIGVIILQGALNKFGSVTIAAYTAANKVEQLIAVAASTVGVTMANYTGQNLGAHDLERIKKGTTKGSLLTIGFSFISLAIALLLPEQLTMLFVDAADVNFNEVVKESCQYLRLTGIFYPPLFMIFIYRNVLQSMGRGLVPLLAGVAELFARTIAAYTLPLAFGYTGIILAGPLAWFAAVIPLAIAYFTIIRKFKF